MKILVTGGAGFIGKHLVYSLLKKNHEIVIFDNFSNSDINSIKGIVKQGVKIIQGDITSFQDIKNASKDQDIIIHLAAKISVQESIENPSETFKINVDGTRNVLIAAKDNNIKKIVVASSAAVYGEGIAKIKLAEGSNTNPISPYGQSKVSMEQEIKKISSKQGVNCDILRFFNIFGKGQSSEYAGVVTKFIEKIKNNESIEIFGDGIQTRDFVAIQDVINAIEKSMLKSDKKNRVYNIASGKSISIKELAESMILLSNKKIKIKYTLPKEGDIKHSQADISLAKKELGYSPKYEIEEIGKLLD